MRTVEFNTLDKCDWQVSTWEDSRKDVEFIIKQIEKYKGKWHLKEDKSGKVAVFGAIKPRTTYYSHSSGIENV